jgi:hypothetical protein
MHVRGNEKFLNPYMPVVGMNPSLYRINNLSTTLAPYVNEIQFYDQYTGKLGPNITPNRILNDMSDSLLSDSRYEKVVSTQQYVKIYNNGGLNVKLVGSNNDITKVTQILDTHFNQSVVASVASNINPLPEIVLSAAAKSAK